MALLTVTTAFSQTLTDFDLRLEAIRATYGAAAVSDVNKQLTGTVQMAGEATQLSFNLFLRGHKSRFEIQSAEGLITVVRRGNQALKLVRSRVVLIRSQAWRKLGPTTNV